MARCLNTGHRFHNTLFLTMGGKAGVFASQSSHPIEMQFRWKTLKTYPQALTYVVFLRYDIHKVLIIEPFPHRIGSVRWPAPCQYRLCREADDRYLTVPPWS